jgi:hypothetical protein
MFFEGQEVYIDRRPYGLDKTKVTRVTKTTVRIADSESIFNPDTGYMRGGTSYTRLKILVPTSQLDEEFMHFKCESALFHLSKHHERLAVDEMEQLLNIWQGLEARLEKKD